MTTTQAPQTMIELYDDDMRVRADLVFFNARGQILSNVIPLNVLDKAFALGLVVCPSCQQASGGEVDDNGLYRCSKCHYMMEG
jgi:hypothetical protein